MSTTTECRIDQLGCVLHGFRDPECKFFNYEHKPPAPRAGERDVDERWETGPPISHGGIIQREVRRAGVDPFKGGHVCTSAARDAEHIVMCHNRHYELINQHAALVEQRERAVTTLRQAYDEIEILGQALEEYHGTRKSNATLATIRELLATIEQEGEA